MNAVNHSTPARRFACRQCGKAFLSREALRNHSLQCREQEHIVDPSRPFERPGERLASPRRR